jgi:hypothetical protein
MISIFAETLDQSRRGLSSLVLSSGLHVAGIGLLSYGIMHAPRIEQPVMAERYTVRQLDLHSPEPRPHAAKDEDLYPRTAANSPEHSLTTTPPKPSADALSIPKIVEGKQTLVQPQVHAQVPLPDEIPIPTVVIWNPEVASAKQIVAPRPQKPSSSEVPPSLETPNEQIDPGLLAITPVETPAKLALPASRTTTPLVTKSNSTDHAAPATVSSTADQPTPTAVLSISDVRMTDGRIVLPPINETHTASPKSEAAQAPAAPTQNSSHTPGPPDGTGVGVTSGNTAIEASKSAAPSTGSGSDTTQHIQLPRDGKFGVVVVGTSLAEEYPETLQVWNDRVAYTAYLHVGLTKNWILQYAQLRSVEVTANGAVARLEAPWPYDIMRPNLISNDNSDTVMVHGILNEAGRLESLAIAFPARFPQAAFVLRTLEQWQFRPARQAGKPTSVEILLIIPDELD